MRCNGRLTALLALVIAVGVADAHAGLSRHDLADAGFHLVPLTPMPVTATLHGPAERWRCSCCASGAFGGMRVRDTSP